MESFSKIQKGLSEFQVDLNINIKAPTIIVPIEKDNNPKSPIWIFSMGYLKVISKEDKSVSDKYANFIAELSSMNIEV